MMQETWFSSLGREDPLEKRRATHSSILAWRIPRTEEPGRVTEIHGGREELDVTERLTFHFHTLPGIVLNALHAFIYLILITTV